MNEVYFQYTWQHIGETLKAEPVRQGHPDWNRLITEHESSALRDKLMFNFNPHHFL